MFCNEMALPIALPVFNKAKSKGKLVLEDLTPLLNSKLLIVALPVIKLPDTPITGVMKT